MRVNNWTASEDTATIDHVAAPNNTAFGPALIKAWMLVFKPIAAIAMMIKNFPDNARFVVIVTGIHSALLRIAAARKPSTNHGKTFARLKFCCSW